MKNSLKISLLGLLLVPTLALAGCSCKKDDTTSENPSPSSISSDYTKEQKQEAYTLLREHITDIMEQNKRKVSITRTSKNNQICEVSTSGLTKEELDSYNKKLDVMCGSDLIEEELLGYNLDEKKLYYVINEGNQDLYRAEYVVNAGQQNKIYVHNETGDKAYDVDSEHVLHTFNEYLKNYEWLGLIDKYESLEEFEKVYVSSLIFAKDIKSSSTEFKVEDGFFKLIFKVALDKTNTNFGGDMNLTTYRMECKFNSSGKVIVTENFDKEFSGDIRALMGIDKPILGIYIDNVEVVTELAYDFDSSKLNQNFQSFTSGGRYKTNASLYVNGIKVDEIDAYYRQIGSDFEAKFNTHGNLKQIGVEYYLDEACTIPLTKDFRAPSWDFNVYSKISSLNLEAKEVVALVQLYVPEDDNVLNENNVFIDLLMIEETNTTIVFNPNNYLEQYIDSYDISGVAVNGVLANGDVVLNEGQVAIITINLKAKEAK